MESALRRDEQLFDRMKERLEILGGHGRRGAGVLRELLALRDPDAAPTEGMFETLIERLLRRAGIEMPVRQYEVWDDDEFIARIDFGRSGSPWGKELADRDATRWAGAQGVLVPFRAGQVSERYGSCQQACADALADRLRHLAGPCPQAREHPGSVAAVPGRREVGRARLSTGSGPA